MKEVITHITLIFFLFGAVHGNAQSNSAKEYSIKAAFIYNFTQFVEWPEGSFEDADSPFVIGILGKDPFGQLIDEIVEGEKVQNHPIIIKRYTSLQEIKKCHILFIANTEAGNIKKIIACVRNKNILTVSDIPGFPEEGGMIGFMMENNKTKLQINPSIAKAADINISSKLLRLAEIVGEKK